MNVANFLTDRNIEFDLIPDRESHDAQRMAATLHVPGREVAKTVLLQADGGYAFIVAILPANEIVDLDRASSMLGGSDLKLATEVDVSRLR